MMNRLRRILRALPIQAALLFWTALVVVPFVLIVLLAFRTTTDIFKYPLGVGGDFTLDNFVKAWQGPPGGSGLFLYFVNTAIIAVVALVVNLGVGLLASYFSTLLAPRARAWFLRVFLISAVIPLILMVVPYFRILNSVDLLNTPAVAGVVYGVLALPTTVLILHAFFVDFPAELVEAAAIDGLTPLGAFLRVVLPLSRGAVFAVGLLALVWVWGESQLGIVMLQTSKQQSIAVGLLGFRGQWSVDLGAIFAGLAIASVPIIVIYLAFNRYITKGIALGGVFR